MSRRKAAGIAGALASLLVAAAAYILVGGLPGLLYAGGVATAGLFIAVRLGAAPSRTDGVRWQRKSTIIAGLRVELEDRERHIEELRSQLEREAEHARAVHAAQEARIRQLEDTRDGLQALLENERAHVAQFLGELTGGIGSRDDELAALERDLAALVGG